MLMSIEFAISFDIGLATHSAGRLIMCGAYRVIASPGLDCMVYYTHLIGVVVT